jgi:hypothetical protein
LSAAKLAATVKEKLPEFEPAVKRHVGALGGEIARGLAQVEEIFGRGVARESSYLLLDVLKSALLNRGRAFTLVGTTVAAGLYLASSRVEAKEQAENAGRQSPAADATQSRSQPALAAATQLWRQGDKSGLTANQENARAIVSV